MATFLIGLVILIGGGILYGKFCENVFGPDDRETPAYAKQEPARSSDRFREFCSDPLHSLQSRSETSSADPCMTISAA